MVVHEVPEPKLIFRTFVQSDAPVELETGFIKAFKKAITDLTFDHIGELLPSPVRLIVNVIRTTIEGVEDEDGSEKNEDPYKIQELVALEGTMRSISRRLETIEKLWDEGNTQLVVPELRTVTLRCEELHNHFDNKQSFLWKDPLATGPYLLRFAVAYGSLLRLTWRATTNATYQEDCFDASLRLQQTLHKYRKRTVEKRCKFLTYEYHIQEFSGEKLYLGLTDGFVEETYGKGITSMEIGQWFNEGYAAKIYKVYSSPFLKVAKTIFRGIILTKEQERKLIVNSDDLKCACEVKEMAFIDFHKF